MKVKFIKNTKKKTIFVSILVIFLLLATGYLFYIKVLKSYPEMKNLPPSIEKKLEKDKQKYPQSISLRIPILMYHYVEYVQDKKDTIRQSLNINPHIFEEQIKTLILGGYVFVTPSEIAQMLSQEKEVPKKAIVLSFDDGYRDFYTDVFPILKKYNVRAITYIVPGFEDKPNYMYSWQVKEIYNSKIIEIGAHTMHHVYLKGMAKDRAKLEISQSKEFLEKQLNTKIVSFAYPYGAFDEQAIELVKEAGFKTAVTTVPGIEENDLNKFFILRLRPGGRTGDALLKFFDQKSFKPY